MNHASKINPQNLDSGNGAGTMPGFTDSAEDELQYCFALSNALIEQSLQAQRFQAAPGSSPVIPADDALVGRELRLRLLQEMLLEQVPSLRNQNAGAK